MKPRKNLLTLATYTAAILAIAIAQDTLFECPRGELNLGVGAESRAELLPLRSRIY